jgi:glycosyltransferase involved in cell wall biosynthesis
MPASLRIAHFIHRYPPALGGSESYFARLSRYLAGRGYRVTVFTTTALDLEAFRGPGRVVPAGTTTEGGVEVRRFPLLCLPAQRCLMKAASLLPLRRWQALTLPWNPLSLAMWRAAREAEPFDVVHATAFPYGFPLACARRLAQRLGVPLLLTPFLHLGDPDDPRDHTRRTFTHPSLLDLARSADRLFVQTDGERQTFASLDVSRSQLILQGLGVDPADCTGGDRHAARAAWGVSREDVVVGHLANLSAEKGTLDLIQAAHRAWGSGVDRLALVLAGPETAAFRRNALDLADLKRARRLGELDDQQKRDFFAGIDVFCLPSRVDSFGLVLLEAWANGVPVVAYRAGGVPWVVRHEQDGLLVRCGDIDGLATALCRLADNPELRRRLGAAGWERTRTEFRWEEKLRIVEDALLISRERSARAPKRSRNVRG